MDGQVVINHRRAEFASVLHHSNSSFTFFDFEQFTQSAVKRLKRFIFRQLDAQS